jgi:hypothetical protein
MDGGTRDAKPLIALAMGDPAGISPELTAKAIGLEEVHSRARLIVVGDRRVRPVRSSSRTMVSPFSSTSPISIQLRLAAALPPGRAANSRSRTTSMGWSWRATGASTQCALPHLTRKRCGSPDHRMTTRSHIQRKSSELETMPANSTSSINCGMRE